MDPSSTVVGNVNVSSSNSSMKENDNIPQNILNFANEHVYEENNVEIFENNVKQKLLQNENYNTMNVLSILKTTLKVQSQVFNTKIVVNIIHTLCKMFHILNAKNSIGNCIKESFTFMSIAVPFLKYRFPNHNDNNITINDGDEHDKKSLIRNGQIIVKEYSLVVLKNMGKQTKVYVETNKNVNENKPEQVAKVLLDVGKIWNENLLNNDTASSQAILLASTWKSTILIIESFSTLFDAIKPKEYDDLLLRTIKASIKNCKEIFVLMSKQLKEREEKYKSEGRDPSAPASLSEKSLSSVKLLRYHQLKLKELVEFSSSRSIVLHHRVVIDHMIASVAFVHPLYGLPNADPVTARSIQGYLHALSATTLKHLCVAVERDNDNNNIDESSNMSSVFYHFMPTYKCKNEKDENKNENLLTWFQNYDFTSSSLSTRNNNKLRTDEEINIELSKLDILLMFIRTSKNFSLQIQLSTIRYIRWIIIYAMELYPYLAMSPQQIQSNLMKMNVNENRSKWRGSHGLYTEEGVDDDDNSFLSRLCKSIRLFLSDSPKEIGNDLDELLLEIISHTHPICKSISKHIWPIVYGRRSSAQNVNGIVQIYQFTKILQNACLRRNILENLGENISMLSDFEKCKVIDQIIVNEQSGLLVKIANNTFSNHANFIENTDVYLTLFESIEWNNILLVKAPGDQQQQNNNTTIDLTNSNNNSNSASSTMSSYVNKLYEFIYNDLFPSCVENLKLQNGYIKSIRIYTYSLRCTFAILKHFHAAGHDDHVRVQMYNDVWQTILQMKPLLINQMLSVYRSNKFEEYSLFLNMVKQICQISQCGPLLACANIDQHITPLLDMFANICKQCVDNYDMYCKNNNNSKNVLAMLQQLKNLQSYIAVSVYELLHFTNNMISNNNKSNFLWIDGLGDKKKSKAFALALRNLLSSLFYKYEDDSISISNNNNTSGKNRNIVFDFILLELVSLVLRFDFGSFIKRQGSTFFVPEGQETMILKYFNSSIKNDNTSSNMKSDLKFKDITAEILFQESHILLTIMNDICSIDPTTSVNNSITTMDVNNSSADADGNSKYRPDVLKKGLTLVENGLKIIHRQLNSIHKGNDDDGSNKAAIKQKINAIKNTMQNLEDSL